MNKLSTLETFEKTVKNLEEGLSEYLLDTSRDTIRDGMIKRFNLAYIMGYKALSHYLECACSSSQSIDLVTFQNVIRKANAQGLLLGDLGDWQGFRELIAKTTDAYEDEIATEIVAGIPRFIEEVVFLRDKLQERMV